MASYKSVYVEDLVQIVRRCALDLMESAVISEKKQDGTYMNLTEISHHNSMMHMYNDGIRMMAQTLIDELTGPKEEADPDG